jgi:Fe-S-cluster-containing dehydrogenase component/CRP-like cAMP-binding protein
MLHKDVPIHRPDRWQAQFGPEMTEADVDRLLSLEPFRRMDTRRFAASCSLRDILLYDSRINCHRRGDILVREGDYGSSAFLILRGSVRVVLMALDRRLLGRRPPRKKSLWRAIGQLWPGFHYPEVRSLPSAAKPRVGTHELSSTTQVFLQDVPGLLDQHNSTVLSAGMIFGELAALSRTPRSATVVAESDEVEFLEIRWQGLRELLKRDDALRNHVHQLYRDSSLATHLRAMLSLRGVPDSHIQTLSAAAQFESHGTFEWAHSYKSVERKEIADRIAAEPLIVEQGYYIDSIVLITAGFARVTRTHGHGQRTVRYLGKGDIFGLDEIVYGVSQKSQVPFQYSLRAVGYVDVLRLPCHLVETDIVPHLPDGDRQVSCDRIARLVEQRPRGEMALPAETADAASTHPDFIEFLRDRRLINGTQAMLIDLDRCTRCDDCVRACAQTHQGNPRFRREGPKFAHYQVAYACMHCADPVCMIGCPTGAIGRDDETGTVLINDATCIGCGTCANNCPYHDIQMIPIRDARGNFLRDDQSGHLLTKATKCDLCIDQFGGPACQKSCPHDALVRLDLHHADRLAAWLNR